MLSRDGKEWLTGSDRLFGTQKMSVGRANLSERPFGRSKQIDEKLENALASSFIGIVVDDEQSGKFENFQDLDDYQQLIGVLEFVMLCRDAY